jgi:uncharacterized OB-fold protein
MEQKPINDISFEKFLDGERLMGSECGSCGSRFVPPRPLCPACHAWEMKWMEMKGTGKLAAFTCITIAPPFMIAQGYNRKNPYCSGVVELDDGGRVDARIIGVDPTEPEGIRVGMPVRVTFIHWGKGKEKETFLAFEPA